MSHQNEQLQILAEAVKSWRIHKRAGDRMPDALWNSAFELCEALPILEVAKVTHLSSSYLRKKLKKRNQPLELKSSPATFVPIGSFQNSPISLSLESRHGKKAAIETSSQDLPLLFKQVLTWLSTK